MTTTPSDVPSYPVPVPPPPGPRSAQTWAEFTTALRELYEWCGSPKYRALCSRATGLSPAAISTLIGKNPLSQPPETATRRFVTACLAYRTREDGLDVEAELTRWTECWHRLANANSAVGGAVNANGALNGIGNAAAGTPEPASAAAPFPEPAPAPTSASAPVQAAPKPSATAVRAPATPRSPQRWRPGRVEVAVITAALTAAVFGVIGLLDEGPVDADKECLYIRGTIPDRRLNLTWSGFYQCPNKVGAAVFAVDSPDQLIGYVDTDPSRFLCWTTGARHSGGNDIWYYTRADRSIARFELQGWGFTEAGEIQTEKHPAPGVTRKCHFM